MDMHATGPGLTARRRILQALLAGTGAVALPALAQPMDRPLDVPFVPTSDETVDRMLRMAGVGPKDYLIDLGSGDGRIVINAAKQFGATGFGVELNTERWKLSLRNAEKEGVADRVAFYQRDLFETDLSKATVLTMYLLPAVNLKLRPRILSELRPGTRVVSHDFDMAEWMRTHGPIVAGRASTCGSCRRRSTANRHGGSRSGRARPSSRWNCGSSSR